MLVSFGEFRYCPYHFSGVPKFDIKQTHGSGQLCWLQGMVQLYYDKYIAKPLRLPTVRLDMAE